MGDFHAVFFLIFLMIIFKCLTMEIKAEIRKNLGGEKERKRRIM